MVYSLGDGDEHEYHVDVYN